MITPPEHTLHHIKAIRIESHTPDNANAISIMLIGKVDSGIPEVKGEEEVLKLTLFDLPEALTTKLLLAFADENTRHRLVRTPTEENKDEFGKVVYGSGIARRE